MPRRAWTRGNSSLLVGFCYSEPIPHNSLRDLIIWVKEIGIMLGPEHTHTPYVVIISTTAVVTVGIIITASGVFYLLFICSFIHKPEVGCCSPHWNESGTIPGVWKVTKSWGRLAGEEKGFSHGMRCTGASQGEIGGSRHFWTGSREQENLHGRRHRAEG